MTNTDRTCSRPKCGKAPRARGLCKAHAKAWLNQNPTIPAKTVANHIEQLLVAGISMERLCAITGMQRRQMVRFKTQKFVTKAVATRVLSVPIPALWWKTAPDNADVLSTGTARRLQALTAMGYTSAELCRVSGYKRRQLSQVIHGHSVCVLASSARRVDEAFRTMQLVPPLPSERSRRAQNRAQKYGWVVPMAWDEEDIDNPFATPRVANRLSTIDTYRELNAQGMSDTEIARELGIKPESLKRTLERAS